MPEEKKKPKNPIIFDKFNYKVELYALGARFLDYFANENAKPLSVKVTGVKRSLDQNALVHAVFEDCARLTGEKNAGWWKEELKLKLGKKSVHIDLDDQPHVVVISTTDYSTAEMAAFCEKIVAHMKTDYDVDIVLPNDPPINEGADDGR